MNNNQSPTHIAVPVAVFQAAVKMISQMPWEQAQAIMVELQKCQQVNVAAPDLEVEKRV